MFVGGLDDLERLRGFVVQVALVLQPDHLLAPPQPLVSILHIGKDLLFSRFLLELRLADNELIDGVTV